MNDDAKQQEGAAEKVELSIHLDSISVTKDLILPR